MDAVARDHGRDRLEEADDVGPKRPTLEVLGVQRCPFRVASVVAAVDLPDTGDAGSHGQMRVLPLLVHRQLFGNNWTRADETHVPEEDVEQLGQLVERRASEQSAEPEHPWIMMSVEFEVVGDVRSKQFRVGV